MGFWRTAVAAILTVPLLFAAVPAGPAAASQHCRFVLGFHTLHEMIPNIVGECVTNQVHNPENGDALQYTTNGMLVWRKSDNFTAFTNGYRTWVNGPFGLQTRLNTERFAWEENQQDQQTRTVRVYFPRRPESLNDFSAVFPVERQIVADQAIGTRTIEKLIAGPTPEEQAQGYFSELGEMIRGESNCQGRDFILRISGGTAELQFCRQVVSAGVGQDARVTNQIEETLTQFSTVDRVRLLDRQGNCLFDLSGMNRCLENG